MMIYGCNKERLFTLEYKNSRLRGTAVFDFFVRFWFLAPEQLLYSKATPIIGFENACVNGIFYY